MHAHTYTHLAAASSCAMQSCTVCCYSEWWFSYILLHSVGSVVSVPVQPSLVFPRATPIVASRMPVLFPLKLEGRTAPIPMALIRDVVTYLGHFFSHIVSLFGRWSHPIISFLYIACLFPIWCLILLGLSFLAFIMWGTFRQQGVDYQRDNRIIKDPVPFYMVSFVEFTKAAFSLLLCEQRQRDANGRGNHTSTWT